MLRWLLELSDVGHQSRLQLLNPCNQLTCHALLACGVPWGASLCLWGAVGHHAVQGECAASAQWLRVAAGGCMAGHAHAAVPSSIRRRRPGRVSVFDVGARRRASRCSARTASQRATNVHPSATAMCRPWGTHWGCVGPLGLRGGPIVCMDGVPLGGLRWDSSQHVAHAVRSAYLRKRPSPTATRVQKARGANSQCASMRPKANSSVRTISCVCGRAHGSAVSFANEANASLPITLSSIKFDVCAWCGAGVPSERRARLCGQARVEGTWS